MCDASNVMLSYDEQRQQFSSWHLKFLHLYDVCEYVRSEENKTRGIADAQEENTSDIMQHKFAKIWSLNAIGGTI